MNYILYGTSACHLCEQAEAIISKLPTPIKVTKIDIVDDDELLSRYGLIIPVLKELISEREIHWPFNSTQALAFIKADAKTK